MFVRPHARGAGIGRRLVEAVIVRARQSVEILQLTVISDNAPARGSMRHSVLSNTVWNGAG